MSADGSLQAPPKRPRRMPWTEAEIAVLREAYGRGGGPAAILALPGRSVVAIYQQASDLGIRSPFQTKKRERAYPEDADVDARIRKFYADPIAKGALIQFARSVQRPAWWVKGRARRLGCVVPRMRELPWTDAELDILNDNAAKTPKTIQKLLKRAGFNRTETGIAIKRKRIGLYVAEERDLAGHYSASKAALGLGVDRTTVCRWIRLGQLKAKHRGTERTAAQGGDEYDIKREDLRRFMAAYPNAVDLRKVDRAWFFDFAFGHLL